MAEDIWIDKVSLKSHWRINETRLIELVLQKVITPYCKQEDGKYHRMPYGEEEVLNVPKWSEWLERETTGLKRTWIDYSEAQVARGLKVYVWFRKIDIDDVEYEGIMTRKTEDETVTSRPSAKADPRKYASVRRQEGAQDAIIAAEMDEAGVSQLEIGRVLCLKKGENYVDIRTIKQRGHRIVQEGRKFRKEGNVTE
jgi:hypothetical protein